MAVHVIKTRVCGVGVIGVRRWTFSPVIVI
eukprot:COSAG01_NODE_9604_length_2394_cov_1.369063_1_plen_29_part_10